VNEEIKRMEKTYSLEQVKTMAQKRGLKTNGAKRDIITRLITILPQTVSKQPSKYLGNWQPGEFAIYSDFGLRSLYIVRILEWPEHRGDRFTEKLKFGSIVHDRSMGSVRAVVIDTTLADWDMGGNKSISEWNKEGSIHYYHYTNLFRNIEELIEKEKRTTYPEVQVRILYDLRSHPGWIMLAAYGLRKLNGTKR
jgi:hypothetical protein